MKPVVDKLEADNLERLTVQRINREDPNNADLVEQYGVRYQPVYILLDANGNIAQQWFSFTTQETFEAAISAIVQN